MPDAVNVQGGVIAEDVRPGIPLTEKLGRVFTALAGEVAQQIDVEVRGEITEYDVKVLELAALKGVFPTIVEDQVSYVNAPLLAAERGTAVRLVTDPESPDHRNLITIRGTLADGSQVSVSGTLIGIAQTERLVEVNGFDVDIEPTDHLAFLHLRGPARAWSALVGRILGDAEVNIAGMQVSRDDKGGQALVALSVDSAIPAETLAEIEQAIDATVGARGQPAADASQISRRGVANGAVRRRERRGEASLAGQATSGRPLGCAPAASPDADHASASTSTAASSSPAGRVNGIRTRPA